MKETKINLSINLRKNINHLVDNLRYRLFLNDDLLVERDWIWDSATKIHEEILIDLDALTSFQNQFKIQQLIEDRQYHYNYEKKQYFGLTLDNKIFESNFGLIDIPYDISAMSKSDIEIIEKLDKDCIIYSESGKKESYAFSQDAETSILNEIYQIYYGLFFEISDIIGDDIKDIKLTTYPDKQIAEFNIR